MYPEKKDVITSKAEDTETNNKEQQTGHKKSNTSKTKIYLDDDDDDDDDKLFVRYHDHRRHLERMVLTST